MIDTNGIVLIGRLTRDADLQHDKEGKPVSNFSIVYNWHNDGVGYIDCTLWGAIAETLNQYLKTGKQVAVKGEIRWRTWETDDIKKSKTIIEVRRIQLLGKGINEDRSE